ncbi:hypothetical protein GW17_00015239 [Ensete ventricosum]|nr:hypothetical protein GW17_00015239 [Ensete ventricosum]
MTAVFNRRTDREQQLNPNKGGCSDEVAVKSSLLRTRETSKTSIMIAVLFLRCDRTHPKNSTSTHAFNASIALWPFRSSSTRTAP